MFNSLPKAGFLRFVTDCYRRDSIEDVKRSRRGSSATYQIEGRIMKLPRDFASFMLNADNKMQLIPHTLLKHHFIEHYHELIRDLRI